MNSPACGCDLHGAKWSSYEYRNIYFQTTYTDFCELPGGLPLDVGSVGLDTWQTFLNVFAGIGAEALVDYAKEVVLPLWKLYAFEYDIADPSRSMCEQEMEEQGYGEWEFVGVEFFSGSSDATKSGAAIVINRFEVTWQISMRKLKE